MVFTSYAGMIGSLPVLAQPLPEQRLRGTGPLVAQCNGVFNDLSPIRLASVTDGLSNTIFIAEKATTILQELIVVNPHLRGPTWLVYHRQLGRHADHGALSAECVRQSGTFRAGGLDELGIEHAPRRPQRPDGGRLSPIHQGLDPVVAVQSFDGQPGRSLSERSRRLDQPAAVRRLAVALHPRGRRGGCP